MTLKLFNKFGLPIFKLIGCIAAGQHPCKTNLFKGVELSFKSK